MKPMLKVTLTVYTLILLWLVLFKTSIDIPSVLSETQIRSLNLVPFNGRLSEMIENFIVFVPLGLLLGATLKETAFWKKLTIVFVFSLAVETTQYILAIGVSDITDIFTNTIGGLLGLTIYKISANRRDSGNTDRTILLIIALAVAFCLFLRFFVFKVKY